MVKKIGLYTMAVFYFAAGVNHFINPESYYPLIPEYLGSPEIINLAAGIVELVFGIALFFTKTRKMAAWGIILMLVAFIPSHVYFIQIGSCLENGLCVSEWLGWIRLILIHPILILWAWIYTKKD